MLDFLPNHYFRGFWFIVLDVINSFSALLCLGIFPWSVFPVLLYLRLSSLLCLLWYSSTDLLQIWGWCYKLLWCVLILKSLIFSLYLKICLCGVKLLIGWNLLSGLEIHHPMIFCPRELLILFRCFCLCKWTGVFLLPLSISFCSGVLRCWLYYAVDKYSGHLYMVF